MTSLKKVTEKVLFVQAAEIDVMGNYEQMNLDSKGFFMFDMSQQPAQPLVSGIPLYIENPGVPTKDPKIMPLVLMVPSCRGQY